MKPLRVLILVTALNRGGIEIALVNYTRELARTGKLHSEIEMDFLVNRPQIGDLEPQLEQMGCKVYRMGAMYPWRFGAYKREFVQFLQERCDEGKRYDIIHSHLEERSFFPLQVGAQFCTPPSGSWQSGAQRGSAASQATNEQTKEQQVSRPRLIAQAHNAYTLSWLDPKSYFRRWFRSGLRKLVRKDTVQPVAVSDLSAQWLFGKGACDVAACEAAQEKPLAQLDCVATSVNAAMTVTILHNPINLEGLKFNEEVRNRVRTELRFDKQCFIVGAVGRLTHQKNHQLILQACAQLKRMQSNLDFKILFVGDGELRGTLLSLAQCLGLNDHLILTGSVSNPGDYLQAMDLFCFPSHFEGLPLAAIEAQAAGLTVLASNSVSREIELTNNVEFLPINDAQIWADRICEAFTRPHSQNSHPAQTVRDLGAFDQVATSPYAASSATDELLRLYGDQ